ncbi:phosphatase PAP2 family protein [Chryseolinea sp. T2]|uniref:phosphatase PAP2 family protein n=1 Tax=Chryseolinea sp. T2 TaxID=3129255 RepID=UPI003077678E
MIETLSKFDERAFLAINDMHTSWLDPVMMWCSGNVIWLPLYAFLLYQLFKLPKARAFVAVICIAIGITFSDQLTSTLIKPIVERPRPTWNSELSAQVHTVDGYRGGHYGFPSSHAANTFCVSVLLSLVIARPWTRWLFVWAALVSYSRIYLGVHYPGDIITGAALGSMCGAITFLLYKAGCNGIEKMKAEKAS